MGKRNGIGVRNVAAAIGCAAAITSGVLVQAGPAAADDLSYVWDDYSDSTPLYGAPSTTYSTPVQYAANGTKFEMDCWLDNDGGRWFFGQIYDTGSWVYVQAVWTYDQTTVPAC